MKLRFSIRDLFWLTLVVALAVGWLLSYRWYKSQIEDQRKHFSDYFNRNAAQLLPTESEFEQAKKYWQPTK
jgi:hypothetical protein